MKNKISIVILIVVLYVFWMGWTIYTFGKMAGYSEGSNAAWEANRESDCKFDYSYKPKDEVPIRCLKYFD